MGTFGLGFCGVGYLCLCASASLWIFLDGGLFDLLLRTIRVLRLWRFCLFVFNTCLDLSICLYIFVIANGIRCLPFHLMIDVLSFIGEEAALTRW